MKKLFSFCLLCLLAVSAMAQRAAIMEFKAGVGISQADVDGLSAIFTTYFRPAGYTMVERTQIDRVIDEQGFQRSSLTEDQMVRIGEILNVSKIVLGDVNIAMGQYNVDARVVNVEGGTIAAAEGATFVGSSYREHMKSIAQKLASKIAISAGPTVSAQPTPSAPTPKKRTSVEKVYGYLHVFPNELGVFQGHPNSVIANINKQGMHGYDEWRVPTNEELSLLRANGYLSGTQYMTKENASGMVLLVTTGKSIAEKEVIRAEQAELARQKEAELAHQRENRRQQLLPYGLVDLGLTSGTLWKKFNEGGEYADYDFDEAKLFGNKLPTKSQLEELKNECEWTWTGDGYQVTGPSGEFITLPAAGGRDNYGNSFGKGSNGRYWSYTPGWSLKFTSNEVSVEHLDHYQFDDSYSVRLATLEYVDLGLPSGTLWKTFNEGGNDCYFNYYIANSKFSGKVPTKEQFEELCEECKWFWIGDGYKVVGPNGNYITFPAAGSGIYDEKKDYKLYGVGSGMIGGYWSSTPSDSDYYVWSLSFASDGFYIPDSDTRESWLCVRLVQNL